MKKIQSHSKGSCRTKITVQNNLDEIDEIEKKDNISLDNRLIIQQARLANKLTQKQIDIIPQLYEINQRQNQNQQSKKLIPKKILTEQEIYDLKQEEKLQDLDIKDEEPDDKTTYIDDFQEWLGFMKNDEDN